MSYNAKDIQILQGLDAVRMRPGMYIGSTGPRGLHHLLWEIIDNSIDEAANGYCDRIIVTLNADNSVTVEDNGRGIPVDIHPQKGITGVEVVFTELHAGGKFMDTSYSYSGGLHGVGASVVNALSRWLTVEVCKDGKVYKAEFESTPDTAKRKIASGRIKSPLREVGKTDKRGTKVTFLPDKSVFETIVFSLDVVTKRLRELAFLNKGLAIELCDLRAQEPLKRVYRYDGGLVDFVKYLNEDKNVIFKEPIFISGSSGDFHMSVAIQYNDGYTESVFSYVNNIPTTEGGMHETGFKAALTKVFNDYARSKGFLKEKDPNFLGEDFREGITAVISVKMKNVQFEGQTKTKLGNPEARTIMESLTADALSQAIHKPSLRAVMETIIKKAEAAAKVRAAARKAKELTRQKNSIENANLVGKLSSCTGKKAEQNELFIVEGDSAGGSAKQARDRAFQAILPLRGKPLNAEKKRIDQVLSNEEIRSIISALGTGIGEDFNLDNLKYHKVIILSDADQDGAHIKCILMTFFFRYMKELISNGHLYIGLPPLYKVETKSSVRYAYNNEELGQITKGLGKNYTLQRYKGLGEMNPDQLWETTMDPARRKLIRVSIEDAAEAEKLITTLMGDNIEARKRYISEHSNFNKQDSFQELANAI
ncbi:MAG: type IIA DNA topoisomerase subunit B [Clostridiales bacterium]|nr:type IIA DNA topoisomerase subunit B [Clostridiales bacterium]